MEQVTIIGNNEVYTLGAACEALHNNTFWSAWRNDRCTRISMAGTAWHSLPSMLSKAAATKWLCLQCSSRAACRAAYCSGPNRAAFVRSLISSIDVFIFRYNTASKVGSSRTQKFDARRYGNTTMCNSKSALFTATSTSVPSACDGNVIAARYVACPRSWLRPNRPPFGHLSRRSGTKILSLTLEVQSCQIQGKEGSCTPRRTKLRLCTACKMRLNHGHEGCKELQCSIEQQGKKKKIQLPPSSPYPALLQLHKTVRSKAFRGREPHSTRRPRAPIDICTSRCQPVSLLAAVLESSLETTALRCLVMQERKRWFVSFPR
jgi:hypothetical protein